MISLLTVSIANGQSTLKEMEGIIAKAKWVQVATDESDNPTFVDSVSMSRLQGAVLFSTKFEKRGTTVYSSHMGNCTTDVMLDGTGFAAYPSNPKQLVEVELEERIKPGAKVEELMANNKVKKGTVGYVLLDYVCKNAKLEKID